MKILSLVLRLSLLLAVLAALSAAASAQRRADPRFGLVGAWQAPEEAAALGTAWEIIEFRWDELQPGGPGDWNTGPATGDYLAQAAGAGREIVGVLVGTPAWATDGAPGSGIPRGLYDPPDSLTNTWATFVRQAVSYGAVRGVNRWAIWQGQDAPPTAPGATWDGSVMDYYRLVKVAHEVAREANPHAIIHLGTLEGADPAWLDAFLDIVVEDSSAAPNGYYFDAVMVRSTFSPYALHTQLERALLEMHMHGITLKEVWGIAGVRPALDPLAYTEDTTFSRYPNITPEQQAAYIVQAHALAFAADRGVRIGVYRLVDDFEADSGEGFGLLRADGSPRPAHSAYRLVLDEFSGLTSARRLDDTHPHVEAVRLAFPDRLTTVAWARTSQTSTLLVPARSRQATLVGLDGSRRTVQPEDGYYALVLEGAACDDPQAGCLIGGMPWLLVEEGAREPGRRRGPDPTVEPGGEPLPLGPIAWPTHTPPPPTLMPTTEPAPTVTAVPTEAAALVETPPAETVAVQAAAISEPVVAEPPGWLRPALIALGAAVIAGAAAVAIRRR
ncbi:MAG TPA: hypothetical protein PK801_14535 [Aggregatilineales bacterium]|nr:hypothetical protein [Aggregatilineales bacterium]HPV07839.1 hypothetical protein [Aggregatilineales bacterium]HQA69539.1 hypothetical protein [Aggregatilineales bacterium]